MSIAQVISRTCQVKRRAMRSTRGNAQQGLRRSFNFDQAAIVCHQHITAAHHMAALQKHRQHPAAGIFGLKATLLTNVPIQRHRGRAFDQCLCQALTARN